MLCADTTEECWRTTTALHEQKIIMYQNIRSLSLLTPFRRHLEPPWAKEKKKRSTPRSRNCQGQLCSQLRKLVVADEITCRRCSDFWSRLCSPHAERLSLSYKMITTQDEVALQQLCGGTGSCVLCERLDLVDMDVAGELHGGEVHDADRVAGVTMLKQTQRQFNSPLFVKIS